MRKRMCVLILTAALALGMTGCGDSVGDAMGSSQPQQGESGSKKENGTGRNQAAENQESNTDENQTEENRGSGIGGDQAADNSAAAGSIAADSDETQNIENEGDREEMKDIELVQLPEWEPVEIPENDALAFVASMQLGWCLGNTFDASNCNVSDELQYESAWCKAMTTKAMIHALAESGFKTIRIPVSWHNHVDDAFRISEVWMNRFGGRTG